MTRPEATHAENLSAIDAHTSGLWTAYAVLQRASRGQTRDGKPFLDVVLRDEGAVVAGKVWSDAPRVIDLALEIPLGTAVKVLFEPRSYQGTVQLNLRNIRAVGDEDHDFDRTKVFGAGHALVADLLVSTLVFDIETVPAWDLRKVPPTVAKTVAKHAERQDGDEGKVMSLSPFFGKVVSLAVADGERPPDEQDVTVFVVAPPGSTRRGYPSWMRVVSEPELLEAFWALAAHAGLVVTYNGRGFDVPFLQVRSLIHGLPARVDLLSDSYSLRPHLDLYRVLTHGAYGLGPASLEVVCWALGLASPKEQMDGSMVATAYAKGDLELIAKYNAGDARATTAVYQKVRDGVLKFRRDW
jgi:hypothetical protein